VEIFVECRVTAAARTVYSAFCQMAIGNEILDLDTWSALRLHTHTHTTNDFCTSAITKLATIPRHGTFRSYL